MPDSPKLALARSSRRTDLRLRFKGRAPPGVLVVSGGDYTLHIFRRLCQSSNDDRTEVPGMDEDRQARVVKARPARRSDWRSQSV